MFEFERQRPRTFLDVHTLPLLSIGRQYRILTSPVIGCCAGWVALAELFIAISMKLAALNKDKTCKVIKEDISQRKLFRFEIKASMDGTLLHLCCLVLPVIYQHVVCCKPTTDCVLADISIVV